MRNYLFLILLFWIHPWDVKAQKEATWIGELTYFGITRYDELGKSTTLLQSVETNTTDALTHPRTFVAISDKNTGALRFMTNGLKVWDADGNFVENGDIHPFSTDPGFDCQQAFIIPLEEYNQDRYIVVTCLIKLKNYPSFDYIHTYELSYSILDAKANNGKGKIIQSKIPIHSGDEIYYFLLRNCGILIKHTDGISSWMIMKSLLHERYRVYKVNACGVIWSHDVLFQDLIPNYDEINLPGSRMTLEIYDNGIIRDVFAGNSTVWRDYFFRLDRSTGAITYEKRIDGRISTNDKVAGVYDLYINSEYQLYSTYLSTLTLGDTIFYQTDYASIQDESTFKPDWGLKVSEVDHPLAPLRPVGYPYTNAQVMPYINGRIFIQHQTSMDVLSLEVNSPNNSCPNCDIGNWDKIEWINASTGLSNLPTPYWYQWYLQNATYFGKGWKAPEMGTPEYTSSPACPSTPLSLFLKDTIRADSIVFRTDEGTSFTWKEDSLRFMWGMFPVTFQTSGYHEIEAIRYINCVSDTVHIDSVEVKERASKPVLSVTDTLYGCGKGKVQLKWSEQNQATYFYNNMVIRSGDYVSDAGKHIIEARTSCSIEKDSIEMSYPDFLFPNLITPNGDGKNDVLQIKPIDLESGHLQVYSSWGDLVYESRNYKHNWNADSISEGIYYYRYGSENDCDLKGWIQIIK
ncbi:MAG: gliding motility-associated C-terminal domain-containing protein [Cytophagaceae bacterium]